VSAVRTLKVMRPSSRAAYLIIRSGRGQAFVVRRPVLTF